MGVYLQFFLIGRSKQTRYVHTVYGSIKLGFVSLTLQGYKDLLASDTKNMHRNLS